LRLFVYPTHQVGMAGRGGHKQVKQVSHPILACLPSIRSHKYLLAKNKQVLVFA
jgi:hypothetical protein